MADDGAGSQRSGATGDMSETSSVRSDAKALQKRAGPHDAEEDLLEQKRSLQDGIFACMYTLVKQQALSSWRFFVIKIVMEGLMNFLVVFNPSFTTWKIDTDYWLWKIVRWALWRSPIMRLYGYHTYITVMYVMAAIVYVCLAGLVWLTLAMRKAEQSKALKRFALVLHIMFDVVFGTCYVAFFDYFVFPADCNFGASVKSHAYFEGVMCMEMPHILHMMVGLVTALVVLLVTALLVVASCDLNPVARGWLASPAAYTRLKILFAKAVFIVVADCLHSVPKPQAVFTVMAACCIFWWNFKTMPFYNSAINCVWTGMWLGVLYTASMLMVTVWSKDQSVENHRQLTLDVLYGIFPVVVGGMAIQALHEWWAQRPAAKFKDLPESTKLKKVHKFGSTAEVEVVSRVMRKFDVDGLVLEAGGNMGEMVIKAGMQCFPNAPTLLILYANFLMEVRKDGPASRTQLQIASKHAPTLVERYQIFCTVENSKRLKDSQDGGMDLQAYVEFKRNYRAVMRVHKDVLQMQCDFWKLLMRNEAKVADIDKAMAGLDEATNRAHQVYKRVMERYPNNGKLLRCYGKFLEEVRNDPPAAVRAYAEAARAGGSDLLLSMNLDMHGAGRPDFLASMDINEDAVVVINAEGTIMMVNQGMTAMFGYAKSELEAVNISLLMPQPFSGRHNSYLQRYTTTGEAHILDTVREVVALHKERYVFPVALCVTKLSGIGADSVFLGLLRPMPAGINRVRVWLSPNGTVLCADQQFSVVCGIMEGDLVGRSLASLVTDHEALEELLDRCRAASWEELSAGTCRAEMAMAHRYLDVPVPVEVTVQPGGTDGQRIFVLSMRRTDGQEGGLLVVDHHMNIGFATHDLGVLVGYPLKKLLKMKLPELLPPPFNALHAKWIRDAPPTVPPTSCRAGQVVHLVTETGSQVPVRLTIRSHEEGASSSSKWVVQVRKAAPQDFINDKRMVLKVGFDGTVRSVSDPSTAVFGYPAGELVGRSLCDFIDIFEDWRDKQGVGNLQLLMLALLDKEMEMPGTSWRVRVSAPPSASGQVVALPQLAGAAGDGHGPYRKAAKPACLQVEVNEVGADGESDSDSNSEDGAAHSTLTIVLWRRELLTGVLELDERLVIRKANPLMGYIVGLPSTSLLKQPLHRYLNIPHHITWSELMAGPQQQKKGALKGTAASKAAVSTVRAFIGPHVDCGTMRLLLQGVRAEAANGEGTTAKIQIAVHPDTNFQGAHADLMRVLKLDGANEDGTVASTAEHMQQRGGTAARSTLTSRAASPSAGPSSAAPDPPVVQQAVHADPEPGTAAPIEAGGVSDDGLRAVQRNMSAMTVGVAAPDSDAGHSRDGTEPAEPGSGSSSSGEDEEGKGDPGGLHRRAATQSEFVAQWVRTITKQASGALAPPHDAPAASDSRPGSSAGAPVVPDPRVSINRRALVAIPEEGGEGGEIETALVTMDGDAMHSNDASKLHASSSKVLSAKSSGDVASSDDGSDGKPDAGGKAQQQQQWEKGSEGGDSSASGSQAASSISEASGTSAGDDLVVDARRGRLLKALNKLMLGPILTGPLARLRLHTYGLLAVMLITHVVCYVVFTELVKQQHNNVYDVYAQALAMDRSQLNTVRVMLSRYCSRANITKIDCCTQTPQGLSKGLWSSANEMESYHQGVYLGLGLGGGKLRKLAQGDLYNMWTESTTEYQLFQDTLPERWSARKGSLFQLGNAFIAATREAFKLMVTMKDQYYWHRTYKFITTAGMGPLFTAYAHSLDLLVVAAWQSLDKLSLTLIVLLVVEALLVQLACTVYQWWLVQRVEDARLVGILAMLGLPGPVLRQLVAKEVKVLDDSDDEDDADSMNADEELQHHGGRPAATAGAKDDASSAVDRSAQQQTPLLTAGSGTEGEGGGALLKADKTSVAPLASRDRRASFGDGALVTAGRGEDPLAAGADSEHGGNALAETQSNAVAHKPTRSSSRKRTGSLLGRGGSMTINGKTLQRSRWNVARFLVPFIAWDIALVLVYAISLVKLKDMQGPLASLNMASRVMYRYTRMRATSFSCVSQDDDASRDYWQARLTTELDLLESEYNALMYGGTSLSQAGSAFTHTVPASTFASKAFADKFFKVKGCLRFDKSTCYPVGHEYYEVTHNGLDTMVRRVIAEARLISMDANEDLRYNGSRYRVMFWVGTKDLYEGLQQAAQLFVDYSIQRYNTVVKMHTILLAVTVVLVLSYVFLMLRPHIAQVVEEAKRQSGLLSHVPPDMDVRGHVKQVFSRTTKGRGARSSSVVPL